MIRYRLPVQIGLTYIAGGALLAPAALFQDLTPAQQFEALRKERSRPTSAPKPDMTDEERTQFVGQSYRLRSTR
jgi:hypothetical protein